ncbi:MAG: hypothetical protein U1D55_12605 [Phycisphaerae bacterium]
MAIQPAGALGDEPRAGAVLQASGQPLDASALQSPRSQPKPPIIDVWSRTDRRHRRQAVLLLIVNLVLFCGLCVFTHWLHVAKLFDFSFESYIAPAKVFGEGTQTLTDFILFPISVENVPAHGIVLGLLVAATVAVPILIAILYRFWSSIPFILAVLVFAHMPWMALTLLGSCIVASLPPFRLPFRFGSALVGMLPVVLYLYLATGITGDGPQISPSQRFALTFSWVLAIIAGCAMMGLVLLLARVVNYRPTAVVPVLAVMFATPVILFHFRVGVDELAYRMLEAEFGPQSRRFAPMEDPLVTTDRIRDLVHRWTNDDGVADGYRPDFLALWGGRVEGLKARVRLRLLCDFLRDRHRAYDACSRFIADHPKSRYVPCVLYIQASALDTRLDERSLTQIPPRRELYSDFPHVQSEESWSALLTHYPRSPLAVAAAVRLAQLKLRRGDVDRAAELLEKALAHSASAEPRAPTTQPGGGVLAAVSPESTLKFEPEPYLFEAGRLAELISENRDDPRFGNAPLEALASLDPRRAGYEEQLLRLAEAYADSTLRGNLLVRWAASQADVGARAERLAQCIEHFDQEDALPEALFRLADLEIQSTGVDNPARRADGMARMRELVSRFGSTFWGRAAADRLTMMDPTAPRPSGVRAAR